MNGAQSGDETMTRDLQHRTNNTYGTILLIEDGQVIGAWETTRDDTVWANYHS